MIEIKETQYTHPEQNTGQHTNGPLLRFVRQDNGPWYVVTTPMAEARVRQRVEQLGFQRFVLVHCSRVEE